MFQSSENNEWIVKGVKTVQEATELISVGFEYVTDIEGFKLFRKRKQFGQCGITLDDEKIEVR